jgi:hypothetical protein
MKYLKIEIDSIMMKRGLSSEEQRIHDIINDDKNASTEEVLRVYTKMKNAYDKGLGEKLYSKEYLKGVILGIESVINFEPSRKGYSVGRLKTIEQELDRQIKEYGFEEVKEPEVNLGDIIFKLISAFDDNDVDTVKSLQKYLPKDEGYDFARTADVFEVKKFLVKKRTALNKGLASHLYDNEYQEDAALMDIQNKLNDYKGLEMYPIKKLQKMEQELDEQIKKYNIVVD